ncbi:hypothetical protein Daus18300_013642 [Diaporthe australafricana]|uniref:Uncharacterized protein n=1 Tax=Diaporthe australafricana TaxID=127596 RepID=A0ABR3VY95_9PEZI
MNIPREQYIGFEVTGHKHVYRVTSRCLIDDNLSVYEISRDGKTFEAQEFVKSGLPLNLYLSRKRRIQRLRWSDSFVEEIPVDGANILISYMPQGGIERHWNRRQVGGAIEETEVHCAMTEEDYPVLSSTDQAPTRKSHCGTWSDKAPRSFAQVAATADAQKSQITSPTNKSVHERGRRALQPLANFNR